MYYTTFNQVSGNFVQCTFFFSCLHGKIAKGFDSGVLSGMLLVDLQKAFDINQCNSSIKRGPF